MAVKSSPLHKGGTQTKGIWEQDHMANILSQKWWKWEVEKAS